MGIKDTIHDFNEMYKEHGQFLEVNGEFYCGSDCEGCKYKGICDFEIVEENIADTYPLRGFVAANDRVRPYAPYPKDNTTKPGKDNRYEGNTLPNQTKRVFKVINNLPVPYKNMELDFILWHPSESKYHCIRQQCQDCEFKDSCDFDIDVREDRSLPVAVDLAAQEPRSFLLTTLVTNNFEKLWADAFANDSIKDSGQAYHTLETLFRMANIDTSINNEKYHLWVSHTFFRDKATLHDLMTLTANYYKEKTPEALEALKSLSATLLESYNSYGEAQ